MSISNLTDQVTNLDLSSKLNQVITPVNNASSKLLDTYIPSGTYLTVELDGSGKFTTFREAISYLTGKWSNGLVTIQLGKGVFTEANEVQLHLSTINIPGLRILGKSRTESILNCLDLFIHCSNTYIEMSNLTVNGAGKDSGLAILNLAHVSGSFHSMNISGGWTGIYPDYCSNIEIANCTISNCQFGISANRGGQAHVESNMSISNCTTGLSVANSSILSVVASGITFSNVTTQYGIERNKFVSGRGIILA